MNELDFLAGGKFLKERRDRAGLSLRQLDERSGVDYQTISNLEKGLGKNPTLLQYYKLGLVLGFTLDEFIQVCGGVAKTTKIDAHEWRILEAYAYGLPPAQQSVLLSFVLRTARMFIDTLPKEERDNGN